MTHERTTEAGEAANALKIHVYDLAVALQNRAAFMFETEAKEVAAYNRPNFGSARRVLRAAELCWAAWEEEKEARPPNPQPEVET